MDNDHHEIFVKVAYPMFQGVIKDNLTPLISGNVFISLKFKNENKLWFLMLNKYCITRRNNIIKCSFKHTPLFKLPQFKKWINIFQALVKETSNK